MKKKKTNHAWLIGIIVSLTPMLALADVNSNLDDYFDGLGYNSHVTAPTAYKGQTANYYSAGGLSLKNHPVQLNIADITLPSINSGCGGIDFYSGGLSFINSAQLKQFVKGFAKAAPMVAMDMGIQTLTPQLKSVMDKFQQLSDTFNQFNMNSCQAAESALTGLRDLGVNYAKKQQCIHGLVEKGESEAEATDHCTRHPESSLTSIKNSSPHAKATVLQNKNIVWDELQKMPFLKSDKALAEMFMSVSGSVVFGVNDKKVLPSLLENNQAMFTALLNGGEMNVYRCDTNTSCLHPTVTKITLSSSHSFQAKIAVSIQNLVVSYANDTPLTAEQRAFLEMTSLPVLTMLSKVLESHENPNNYVNAYAEVISQQALAHYLQDITIKLKAALSASQADSQEIAPLLDNLNRTALFIDKLPMDALKRINMINQMIVQRKKDEEIIESELASMFGKEAKLTKG